MSAAALTPRVRILAVCDEVTASETEAGVFTLEGVRQHLRAESFPCLFRPSLFLLLSCPRKGTYPGKVLLIHERPDHTRRYVRFSAEFEEDNELLPRPNRVGLDLARALHPEEQAAGPTGPGQAASRRGVRPGSNGSPPQRTSGARRPRASSVGSGTQAPVPR
jgi:hypothetical protein